MKWTLKSPINSAVLRKFAPISELEAQLLFNRGIKDLQGAQEFFDPDLKRLADPVTLPGAKEAVKVILKAIKEKKRIVIYGDYDVDGVCSTSILFDLLFRYFKADILPFVPDRFEEGYGLSKIGLDKVLEMGAELIITVDCGIRDAALISKYLKKGLNFIVTDHHTLPDDKAKKLTKLIPVVHPLLDKEYAFPQICATAVVFKLMQLLVKEGTDLLQTKPDLNGYLDLVALATVCDIMPLIGENRILVNEGLKLINSENYNEGLKQLSKVASISSNAFDTYHFGFVLGPRLNAAGRIEHALDGVRLLTSKDGSKIKQIAMKLNELNFKRQQITKKILEQALISAEEQVQKGNKLIFVYSNDWNEGVVGLVASRINDRYHLPVLVANLSKGIVKGSARSINGFDITQAIALNAELLLKFGGHNQAAGFSLKEESVENFKNGMQNLALEMITPEMLLKELQIDLSIDLAEVNDDLYYLLQKFKPFGYGNPEPILIFKKARVFGTPTAIGQERRHLRFNVTDGQGHEFQVIGFNMIDKIDTIRTNAEYDLAGNLSMNTWNGRSNLQIKLKDLKLTHEKD
jgi:single-stranded-DNA-specific exonuclease